MNKFLNKILTILIVASSGFTMSQEVNEDFINSLPDDLLKEVISDEEKEYDEDVYYSDNSKINKTSIELQRLMRDAKKLELQLENLSKEEPELKRFGETIFTSFQTTFMPINEPNVDPKYVVDVGDGIRLQVIGSLNLDEKLRVSRDGSINVPEIGKIFVAGLELNEVSSMIKKLISDSFLGSDAFITLDEIRNIKVYVLGNVPSPGLYTLNGNSNVMHALSVAGGISENGSFRNIEIKRDGKLISSTDLYSILIYGDTSSNTSLRSGDVILVKPIKKVVSISGAVSRPAIYELNNDENLNILINFSGGITGDFVKGNIELSRVSQNKKQSVNYEDILSTELNHNDSIYVPFFKPEILPIRTAIISGAVRFPGEYNIAENETLSSLIRKAGGYKKEAYQFGGVLIRQDALKKTRDFNQREYGNLVKFLVEGSKSGTGVASAGILTNDSTSELLEEIRNYRLSNAGRFSVEFDLDKIAREPSLDTKIFDGDALYVPTFSNEVYLLGEFNDPGTRGFKSGASVSDYINMAGGFSDFAFKNGIIVISPDGTTKLFEQSRFVNLVSENKIDIYPQSVIFVPRDVSKVDDLTRNSAVAQIFATAMLPILTLISISEN
tara:strand:+ start:21102 stop:22937 length:1836 start_codon:yes stop_codon:yes gene_type:complete